MRDSSTHWEQEMHKTFWMGNVK